jgi:pullulanase/glycogen debranching enzyme
VKSWIYRLQEMRRSVLSWMHWRQRKAQRQWETEQRLLLQIRLQHRMLLLEAMVPLAEALQRLDNLQRTAQEQQHKHLQYQEELLLEVLNSLQPSASQQIFQRIGPQMRPPSYPSSAS